MLCVRFVDSMILHRVMTVVSIAGMQVVIAERAVVVVRPHQLSEAPRKAEVRGSKGSVESIAARKQN